MLDNTVEIRRLLLQETGTYSTQFLRPYQIPTEGRALDGFADRINRIGERVNEVAGHDPMQEIGSRFLAGMSSGLLIPEAGYERKIIIPNGWDTPRLRFVMEVAVGRNSNRVFYFQGYSEHADISLSGHIDENMLFFINSFVEVVQNPDPLTRATHNRVIRSGHLVDGRLQVSNALDDDGHLFGLRPYDIFKGMNASNTMSALSYENHSYTAAGIDLSTTSFASNRSNNIPSSYLSKMVNSQRQAAAMASIGRDNTGIYGTAMQNSYENGPYENPFLRALADHNGRINAATRFTLSDLVSLDPNMPDPDFSPVRQPELLPRAGQDEWHRPDMETQLASLLANSVPALMMECLLIRTEFDIHNHTLDGRPDVRPIGMPISLTGVDETPYLRQFFHRLETEIWPDLVGMDQLDLSVRMTCDLNFDSFLQIQLEGNPVVEYNIPSFCDAILIPTMTMDQRNYDGMIAGMETLVDRVSPSLQSMALTNNINYDV